MFYVILHYLFINFIINFHTYTVATTTPVKDIPVVHKLLNELIFIKSTKEHPGLICLQQLIVCV
jgi:hypothetical protein